MKRLAAILALKLALSSSCFAAEELPIAWTDELPVAWSDAPPAFTAGPAPAPALPAIDFDLSALDAPRQAATVPVTPVAAPVSYTSPPGRHRHLMADGTVIEHGNQNNHQSWTPAAHAGMIQNVNGTWPQYTGPLAPQIWRP